MFENEQFPVHLWLIIFQCHPGQPRNYRTGVEEVVWGEMPCPEFFLNFDIVPNPGGRFAD